MAGNMRVERTIGAGGLNGRVIDDGSAVRRTSPRDSSFALAVLALAEVAKSLGFFWKDGSAKEANVVITASWFPLFALFAAAPLFLYDRTAANESGPLLQLNRTPEVRTTARAFSVSSIIWLAAGVIYLMYEPIRAWLFGGN